MGQQKEGEKKRQRGVEIQASRPVLASYVALLHLTAQTRHKWVLMICIYYALFNLYYSVDVDIQTISTPNRPIPEVIDRSSSDPSIWRRSRVPSCRTTV